MAMVRAKKNIVSYVRELKPRKDTSRIEVRIVRLWRNYNKESGNTIEMVVVDKEVSIHHTKCIFLEASFIYLFCVYKTLIIFVTRGQEFMLQLVNNSSKISMTSYAREKRLSSSCLKCRMQLVNIVQRHILTKLASFKQLLLEKLMIFQVQFSKSISRTSLIFLVEIWIIVVWLVS